MRELLGLMGAKAPLGPWILPWLVMALALALPWECWGAPPVGRLTLVEGRVDLVRGDTPAVPLKVGDDVEPGDAIRTKSLSRARVLFLDDSSLDIAPESRVAIEEYLYDAAQGKRQAVLRIFRGLIKATVSRIKAAEPDFLMKTHTAVLGVRGTKTYVNPGPAFTDAYNEEGRVSARNIHSEIPGEVTLKAMEFCRIGLDLPPTLPLPLAKEDLQLLRQQFNLQARQKSGGAGGAGADPSAASPSGPAPAALPGQAAAINLPNADPAQSLTNRVTDQAGGLYVPPSPRVSDPGNTFSFSQTLAGSYLLTSPTPQAVGTYAGSGSGSRTGVYAGSFNGTFTLVATSSPSTFSSYNTGTISLISQGSVQGVLGRVLTGTMTMTGSTSGGTGFTLRGPVTLQAGGNLTFSPTGSFSLSGRTGPVTGTVAQTAR